MALQNDRFPAAALQQAELVDISKPSEAVDHTISVVEEVSDLVSIGEADGV